MNFVDSGAEIVLRSAEATRELELQTGGQCLFDLCVELDKVGWTKTIEKQKQNQGGI